MRGIFSQWRIALVLALLIAIAGLTIFLYSGWHQHKGFTSQACAFFQFEKGTWSPDSIQPACIDPPPQAVFLVKLASPALPEEAVIRQAPARSPPA